MSENGKKYWWNAIKQQSDDDIIGYINGYVISQIQGEYGGDVFTPLLIKNPKAIRSIINKLDPLVLSKVDS
jgi:type I restriction enzyme M protein